MGPGTRATSRAARKRKKDIGKVLGMNRMICEARNRGGGSRETCMHDWREEEPIECKASKEWRWCSKCGQVERQI